jgi:hypothetical protein
MYNIKQVIIIIFGSNLNLYKMKKITFLSVALVVSMFLSCKQDNNHNMDDETHMMNDSTMMHNDSTTMNNDHKMMNDETAMYSCPMHPEVHGKMHDKCSECGMELTEPVINTTE